MFRTFIVLSAVAAMANAFHTMQVGAPVTYSTRRPFLCRLQMSTQSEGEEEETSNVEKFLATKFPEFHSLISMNENVWKDIRSGGSSTFFAPNSQAFENLGEKKRQQLQDPRNLEVAQKTGLYHIIASKSVTYQELCTEDWRGSKPTDGGLRPFSVGGIVTLGGEVPVGRSRSGGFLGIGAKEDGGAVVGPSSKILKSYQVGDSCIVHEVDDLISPLVLWRYCDQLRIPGF